MWVCARQGGGRQWNAFALKRSGHAAACEGGFLRSQCLACARGRSRVIDEGSWTFHWNDHLHIFTQFLCTSFVCHRPASTRPMGREVMTKAESFLNLFFAFRGRKLLCFFLSELLHNIIKASCSLWTLLEPKDQNLEVTPILRPSQRSLSQEFQGSVGFYDKFVVQMYAFTL